MFGFGEQTFEVSVALNLTPKEKDDWLDAASPPAVTFVLPKGKSKEIRPGEIASLRNSTIAWKGIQFTFSKARVHRHQVGEEKLFFFCEVEVLDKGIKRPCEIEVDVEILKNIKNEKKKRTVLDGKVGTSGDTMNFYISST